MKEIGGYIEFEYFSGEMLHGDGIKLNNGRSCLEYLIEAKKIDRIFIPAFLCECIAKVCEQRNVEIIYYHINDQFMPYDINPRSGDWIYLVNYYGQLSDELVLQYKSKYENIILDNVQAYFVNPIDGIDTIYSCRKFFGVPDGGILYTDKVINIEAESYSYDRYRHIIGRMECNASDFYRDFLLNEKVIDTELVKRMSKSTNNILHGIDYDFVNRRRANNHRYLNDRLNYLNRLKVINIDGAFMYPLFIDNGDKIRKKLIDDNIFIPKLWPNVLDAHEASEIEKKMAKEILPIPCDQRYDCGDMDYLIDKILRAVNELC